MTGPFAGYEDFGDCESKNRGKGDSGAYCGEIHNQVEKGRKRKGEPLHDHQDKESSRRRADIFEEYGRWLKKNPGMPAGAGAIDQLNEETPHPKAINKLKQQQGISVPMVANVHAKSALMAEEGYIWSKSPSTVHTEFANRMAKGDHPNAVFRQLIAEIADHHTKGTITNRDAHRAANEAFGRLLMARKKKASPGLAPLGGGDDISVDPGLAAQDMPAPQVANPHSTVAGPNNPAPVQGGQGSRIGRRKQAWQGWGMDIAPKRHKVAGWEWDEYLNAHIANSPRKFECSCGQKVNVPDYHRCKCGKVWNTYVIGTGGDRREASAEKFIAREVPERENVIVAKRHAGYDDYDKALNDWKAEEESMKEFPSNHVPKVNTDVKGKTAPDWHSRDHKTQRWLNKG